jgi:hypothetical protein
MFKDRALIPDMREYSRQKAFSGNMLQMESFSGNMHLLFDILHKKHNKLA